MTIVQPDSHLGHFDVAITGGGLVGASLACALSGQGMRIALIESHTFNVMDQPTFDDRAIAISYGSSQIFTNLDLWPELAEFSTPIKQIHVSDQGHFGFTRILHQHEGVEALGYVISAKALGTCLHRIVTTCNDVHVIAPARVTGVTHETSHIQLQVTQAQVDNTLSATLAIGADGGRSSLRALLNMSTQQTDYRQTAISCNLTTDRPHHGVAYERFTNSGPIALLPIKSNQYSLVWTQESINAPRTLQMTDDEFKKSLHLSVGHRVGNILKVGQRNSYPLQLTTVKNPVKPRCVLIGNAAHTLHPIAGQGFNLGMRDVAVLAQIIVDALRQKQDIGGIDCLNDYLKWRISDYSTIIGLTDQLVRLFSNRFAPLALARNFGMVAMDLSPSLKSLLSKYTMGMAGKLPRLSRGLPL